MRLYLVLVASLVLLPSNPETRAEENPDGWHRRADAALESLLSKFWRQSRNYLRDAYPGTGVTGYWTFAQAFDAVVDAVERTGGERFFHFIELFYQAQESRGWFAEYYDDECWMALALLRAYDAAGDPRYLAVAEALFQDIQTGWDETCCGAQPGGIWWDRAESQKATASNAGPVIAGARLAERTGKIAYLDFAKRVYGHWLETMVDPATHQVTDHVNPDGELVRWRFTYNEGLMIGASVELYRATGAPEYLETAREIASFLLARETEPSPLGSPGAVLTDGDETRCTGDCHAFKGPAYRYLAELYRETGDPEYYETLAASAEAIWELARSPDTLFGVSWTGPPPASASEPQMCAAVMALNIFAALAGPYGGPPSPPLRYEAEDAKFRGIGLEAKYGDFSGWGYLAGWLGEGQEVEFLVKAPHSGTYEVVFRYAAGAGYASRAIEIEGDVAYEDFLFPETGSWYDYAETSFLWNFEAGGASIVVAFRPYWGSMNYLNLDYVELRPLGVPFDRADANADRAVDMSDAVWILGYLFLGDPERLLCEKSADADDGGSIEMADAIWILRYLFLGDATIPPPSAGCGFDPTDDALGCESFPPCRRL